MSKEGNGIKFPNLPVNSNYQLSIFAGIDDENNFLSLVIRRNHKSKSGKRFSPNDGYIYLPIEKLDDFINVISTANNYLKGLKQKMNDC